MEIEDLTTYAQMWCCNFIGLYEDSTKTDQDNRKILFVHLKQRFLELLNYSLRRAKNCKPDLTDMALLINDTEPSQAEYNPNQRKKQALKKLNELLKAMPHEQALNVLLDAVNNSHIHPDARKFANKLLKKYKVNA